MGIFKKIYVWYLRKKELIKEKREQRNILRCRLTLSEVDSNDCCHLFKAR